MVEEGLNIVFWTLKDRFLSKKKQCSEICFGACGNASTLSVILVCYHGFCNRATIIKILNYRAVFMIS